MLEADIEADVVNYIKDLGGFCSKLKDVERGFPDRTIFLPGGIICFVELKRPKKNKTYYMQKVWAARLTSLGFVVRFCQSLDEVKALVETLFNGVSNEKLGKPERSEVDRKTKRKSC